MKLEQSQLDYLKKRGSNYDRKYRMFELLLEKIPNKLDYVLELFGGVGIQSWYLQNMKDINKHIFIDIDEHCNFISNKMLPNVNRINCNCFNYDDDAKINLIVIDCVFNKKEFNNIVDLVNKFDFDYLILTNTGVFNVRFNKQLSYEQYWSDIIAQLQNNNLFTSDVVYSSDFGLMLIKKTKSDNVTVEKLSNGDFSKDWRKYVNEVYANENI